MAGPSLQLFCFDEVAFDVPEFQSYHNGTSCHNRDGWQLWKNVAYNFHITKNRQTKNTQPYTTNNNKNKKTEKSRDDPHSENYFSIPVDFEKVQLQSQTLSFEHHNMILNQ